MEENWLVCLKHGDKYSAEYVNKLYNMAKRHSTVPFKFACITEDPGGLNSDIVHIPIPNHKLSGWWYKTWIFSNELPINGNILFFDLDVVIIKNIDQLWTYRPGQFCIIRDFNRHTVKTWEKFNSSVFRFRKGEYAFVWDNLVKDMSAIKRLHGDQDWIYSQIKGGFSFWPDEWMQSYKWEIRNKNDLVRDKHNRRVFREIAYPKIDPRTSVLVFHGDPKPSEVEDPIVVQNWC